LGNPTAYPPDLGLFTPSHAIIADAVTEHIASNFRVERENIQTEVHPSAQNDIYRCHFTSDLALQSKNLRMVVVVCDQTSVEQKTASRNQAFRQRIQIQN
jgi:hypothetical protein